MSLPANVTEAEFLAVVAKITVMLWNRFGSIHGTKDDFSQQVVVWSLEALPNYDPSRSLAAFLFAHVRNRAINAIRDKVARFDYPCEECHSGNPCGPHGDFCPKYDAWFKRNRAKADLSRVRSHNQVTEQSCPSTAEDEAIGAEFASKIESELPDWLRNDFRKMTSGEEVAEWRQLEVRKAVAKIVGEARTRERQAEEDFETGGGEVSREGMAGSCDTGISRPR